MLSERYFRIGLSLVLTTSLSLVGCNSSHTKKAKENAKKSTPIAQELSGLDAQVEKLLEEAGELPKSNLAILNDEFEIPALVGLAEEVSQGLEEQQVLLDQLAKLSYRDLDDAVFALGQYRRQKETAGELTEADEAMFAALAEQVQTMNAEFKKDKSFKSSLLSIAAVGGAAVLLTKVGASSKTGRAFVLAIPKLAQKAAGWAKETYVLKPFVRSHRTKMGQAFLDSAGQQGPLVKGIPLSRLENTKKYFNNADSGYFVGLLRSATGYSNNSLRNVNVALHRNQRAALKGLGSVSEKSATRIEGVSQMTAKTAEGKEALVFEITRGAQRYFAVYTDAAGSTVKPLFRGNQNTETLRKLLRLKEARQARIESLNARAAGINAVEENDRLRKLNALIRKNDLRAQGLNEHIVAQAVASAKTRLPLREKQVAALEANIEKVQKALAPKAKKLKKQTKNDGLRKEVGRLEARIAELQKELASNTASVHVQTLRQYNEAVVRAKAIEAGVAVKSGTADLKAVQSSIKSLEQKLVSLESQNIDQATAHLSAHNIKALSDRSHSHAYWSMVTAEYNQILKGRPLNLEQTVEVGSKMEMAAVTGLATLNLVSHSYIGFGVLLGADALISGDGFYSYDPIEIDALLEDLDVKEITEDAAELESLEEAS